ncbi:hypothetical protein [Streptococcus agalactiae]|uniref:hypothetical protein n=1 Tax=Streptococcus agalactiae TaxID=1311 RepID=UPI003C739164
MSKYKIAALTAIASLSLLTTSLVKADEGVRLTSSPAQGFKTSDPCTHDNKGVTLTSSPAQGFKTSDPCNLDNGGVHEGNFINIALPGGRGSEGINSEKIDRILKNIPHYFTFSFNTKIY